MVKKYMRKISLLFLLFIIGATAISQEDQRLKLWDSKKVEAARKAATAEYLTKNQVEMVFLMNLARTDGSLFYESFVIPYEEMNESPKDTYIRSLKKDLQKVKDYPLLFVQEDLTNAAVYHAESSGKSGQTGHPNYENRMLELNKKYKSLGENADYGRLEALDIVMSLLIDRGIPDLGHRINILNPQYNSIGIGTATHKKYRTNTVMEFGEI